jgi:hypothetical protein
MLQGCILRSNIRPVPQPAPLPTRHDAHGIRRRRLLVPGLRHLLERSHLLDTRPLPFGTGGRPTYDSMLACCKGAYAGQSSGACLASLPNPPTQSPTGSGGLDVYYPNYLNWASGKCINDRPLPNGRPSYGTQQACCSGAYGGQTSNNCMCDAVGVCYSCSCGSAAEHLAASCTLTCS